jgi:aspartyl-tRNA(Asn)/glutamyl-tRNA(Gln) amidotransferase subunit B
VLTEDFVAECKASLPELPDAKRARYVDALGVSQSNTTIITAEVETVTMFEATLKKTVETLGKPEAEVAQTVANWIVSNVMGEANRRKMALSLENFSPTANTAVINLVSNNVISGTAAKEVFTYYLDNRNPSEDESKVFENIDKIVAVRGLKQTSDTVAIEAVIAEILAANADKVEQYKGGKEALFGFFVGQTMKAMAGKANPKVVNDLLKKALG